MRSYLKHLREEKNLSQHNVAEQIQISQQAYSLIEKGERQRDMTIGRLYKLAEIFEVGTDEIIKMENDYQNTNSQKLAWFLNIKLEN